MTGKGTVLTAKYAKYAKKDGEGRWIATLTLAMTFKGNALLGQYKPQGHVFASRVYGVAIQFLTFIITLFIR